jgi:hypothetical protein
VIAATVANPGVILRRPVGSDGSFREHADLPRHLAGDKRNYKQGEARRKPKKQVSRSKDKKAARKIALTFEREQRRAIASRRP